MVTFSPYDYFLDIQLLSSTISLSISTIDLHFWSSELKLDTLLSGMACHSVSLDIQTPRSELKNEAIAPSFLTNVSLFGYLMKHDFRVYDIISQTNPYLKRKSGLNLTKFFAN